MTRTDGLGATFAVAIVLAAACDGPREPLASRPDPRTELAAVASRLRSGHEGRLGLAPLEAVRARLADDTLTPPGRLGVLNEVAALEMREGETGRAVEQIEGSMAILRDAMPAGPRDDGERNVAATTLLLRAQVYLRHAETTNCIARHTARSCILPIAADGVHTIPGPAREARTSLLEYLSLRPDDLAARWLLNVVGMTLGEWPDGVPAVYRIGPEAFASDEDIGSFPDVAPELGVNTFDMAGGVAVEDFDGDGRLDVLVSTSDPDGPAVFYRNTGAGRFEDRSAAAKVDAQLGGANVVAADYDGDGDLDVLVLRGAGRFDDGRVRLSLLQNDGRGTFADVTHEAGLAEPAYPTQAAVWADFDGDGALDLFVGSETSGHLDRPGPAFPSRLFRNDGDGTFTDVAAAAGVTNEREARAVAAGDYDEDGDPDLFVANVGGSRLYRNEGGWRFNDVAPGLGLDDPRTRPAGAWFFDYDEDGALDLWVSSADATLADVAADHLGKPFAATPPRVYRNRGDATFAEVADALGLRRAFRVVGATFGDVDGDGWLDVYLGTGEAAPGALMPNVMLRNAGGRRFRDVTTAGGLGHLQQGNGIAFADLDDDGDADVYHQLGGAVRGDRFGNALYRNPGHGHRFLYVTLAGTRSNRLGVGTRLAIELDTPSGPRRLHRTAGGAPGGSPVGRLEIGLGDATRIRAVHVWWPASGTRQRIEGVPLDAHVAIREDGDGFSRRRPLTTSDGG